MNYTAHTLTLQVNKLPAGELQCLAQNELCTRNATAATKQKPSGVIDNSLNQACKMLDSVYAGSWVIDTTGEPSQLIITLHALMIW